MNERIKELAEQARKHFPKTESSGEFWVFDEQKFAELIVRECLSLAHSHPSQNEDYAAGIDSVRESIKEHFGVEE